MKSKLFLDTAFTIALSSSRDVFHAKAIVLANKLKKKKSKLITTRAVLLEIGNALSRAHFRQSSIKLLAAIESDPNIEIITLSENLYWQAFQLYKQRTDKEWGLVDCISFIFMQELEISEALTSDEHFQQAGFRALLREDNL